MYIRKFTYKKRTWTASSVRNIGAKSIPILTLYVRSLQNGLKPVLLPIGMR